VQAFQASSRMCAGDPISAVRFEVAVLPGLTLVWTGAALFVFYMALLLASSPREESGRKDETTGSGAGVQAPTQLSQVAAAQSGDAAPSLPISVVTAGGQEFP